MAEILGTVASIVALVQVAGQTAVLGYGYISGVKRAPEDIRKFLDELESLSKVLTALGDVVKENPDSVALKQLDASLQECLSEMSGLQAKMEPKEWWRKKLARYKWPLRGKETAEYTARIERHKSSFSLALNTEQLSRTKIIEANMKELKDGQKEEKRRKILHWMSPEDFNIKHIEISDKRQESTGEWLLKRPEVRNWVKNNFNSPLLWGYGIPGAGKTFLSSRVIDHLLQEAQTSRYGVAYVYFDYKERDQQKPVNVLASLVKQLVLQVEHIPKEIEAVYDKLERQQKRPRLNEVYTMLLVIIKSFSQTFIVCDALDECDQDDQRRELLPLFHRMGRDGIKVFLTSREHPEDIQDSLQGSAKVELSAQAEDITSYVKQKIHDNPRARRLFQQGDLQDRLIAELTNHTKGMFLLVRFHTEYLCQQTTVREILRELERLKTSLSEDSPLDPVYNRAMEILRDQHKNLVGRALRILSWLVKGRRTLTVHELQQAVSLEQGQTELDQLDQLDRKTILDVCASLVTIDERSDTVRLAHYTVQEYLLKHSIIPEDADFKIAMACTTFLSFDVFAQGACTSKGSLDARYHQYPLLDYAARKLSFHLRSCDEELPTSLILKFLKNPGCVSSYTQAFYIPKFSTAPDRWNEFPKNHLALHVAASLGLCSAIQLLLDEGKDIMAQDDRGQNALHCAAFGGHIKMIRLLLAKGIDISTSDWRGWSALHWAASSGYESVVLLLLEEGADISATDDRKWTALHGAIAYAYESVIRVLLEKGADVSAVDDRGSNALHWAAAEGSESMIQLLLDKGANISAVDDRGSTALHVAVSDNGGNEPVARLLLEKGVNILAIDDGGLTAIYRAANCGNESIVRLLLEKGANMSAGRWTALHGAAARGHEPVVRLLLEKGADISTVDERGSTVLHSAVLGLDEYEPAVRLLLEKGADISAVDDCGLTALHWAATRGHESVVQLLVEKGADISATDEFGWTVFHKAVEGGYESIAMFLLEKGANISATNNAGMTALHGAVARGNESMMQFLLMLGANISITDNLKRGVLHWAAQAGDESIVRVLLERGVDVSAVSEGGVTPLHWAADHGHDLVVRLLLERGASALATDDNGETVLHCAARGGHGLVVRVLLENGADPSAKTNDGITVLQFAESGGHELVAKILETAIKGNAVRMKK